MGHYIKKKGGPVFKYDDPNNAGSKGCDGGVFVEKCTKASGECQASDFLNRVVCGGGGTVTEPSKPNLWIEVIDGKNEKIEADAGSTAFDAKWSGKMTKINIEAAAKKGWIEIRVWDGEWLLAKTGYNVNFGPTKTGKTLFLAGGIVDYQKLQKDYSYWSFEFAKEDKC